MFAVPQEIKIITVTKLNRFAKQVLESEIGQVWVSGEISNFVQAASGHWYFTLKDEKAQVKTAMFKGANRNVSFQPKHGDKVIVRANISLYEARGDYQLIALSMEPEGLGKLKQAYEALKASLDTQGLFAHESKKQLPSTINKIGLITSSTGAAVHDILHVLQRRNPSIEVIIYPSMVQGDGAAATIVKQITLANQRSEVDVLIVGRGGGSLEDLWPFNEEVVARAIFESDLPVVSAVGHEVDVCISDFVADVRAATPSAAAEMLSTDKQELMRNLNQGKVLLMRALESLLENKQAKLTQAHSRLMTQHPSKKLQQNQQAYDYLFARLEQQHPNKLIKSNQQQLSYLHTRLLAQHPLQNIRSSQQDLSAKWLRLTRAVHTHIERFKQKQRSAEKNIEYLSPLPLLGNKRSVVHEQVHSLKSAMANILKNKQGLLAKNSALLDTVSPLATLSRGYSLAYQDSTLLKSITQVDSTKPITTKLADGEITSQIIVPKD